MFETKIVISKLLSFGYLLLAIISLIVLFCTIKTDSLSTPIMIFGCYMAVACFGLELMHFIYAYHYYPNKYTQIKDKTAPHSIISNDLSFLRGSGTLLVYPLPLIVCFDIPIIEGYLINVAIHLFLATKTQPSNYVTEKKITINFKYFLPHCKNNVYSIVTYYVPLEYNEIEYRDTAIIEKIKKIKKQGEETEVGKINIVNNHKKINNLSKEIADKLWWI